MCSSDLMEPIEELIADLWATGISPSGHPTEMLREELTRMGVTPANLLSSVASDKVVVAGTVTHRQRPMTAQGVTFINLEDETGLINVVCSQGCWVRYRKVARSSAALVVRGRLEVAEGVVNVVAEHLAALPMRATVVARNFR